VLRRDWRRRRISARAEVRFVSYPLGGGGSGNGTKQVIGLVALIAVAAFATFVTDGAAAGLLGSAFAAGTFGASALGAAIGIGGALLVNALIMPKPGATNHDDEQQIARVCEIRLFAQYAPVNDAGAIIGPLCAAVRCDACICVEITDPGQHQGRRPPGRYTVRFARGDASLQSPIGTGVVIWAGLRAFRKGSNSFPDVSTIAIRLLASQSTQGSYKFGVLATRKLAVWTGAAFVTQATRNPAWALLDAVVSSQYGSGLPISKVDLNAVAAHAAGCVSRGDTFDYRFTTAVAVPDVLDPARVARQPLLARRYRLDRAR
jgi:hypothetical protein